MEMDYVIRSSIDFTAFIVLIFGLIIIEAWIERMINK